MGAPFLPPSPNNCSGRACRGPVWGCQEAQNDKERYSSHPQGGQRQVPGYILLLQCRATQPGMTFSAPWHLSASRGETWPVTCGWQGSGPFGPPVLVSLPLPRTLGGHSAGNDIIDEGGWVPAQCLEKTTLGEMSQPEVPSWAFSGRETEDLGEDTAAQDRLLQCLLS